MTKSRMQHIPLTSAYLCQDCSSVGNCANQCPACASTALLGLSAILNRETDVQLELEFVEASAIAA
jgi:hypothetical protein